MTKLQFPDPFQQTLIGFENLINRHSTTYPPYNLYKGTKEGYVLEIAVSGWARDELEVELTTGNTLKVTGTKSDVDTREYLHRGLAHRSWTRTWTLEPDICLSSVHLQDGLLTIYLESQPVKSSRKININ
jgi:molecular chaperone IbpA